MQIILVTASPACTELEMVPLNWLGNIFNCPFNANYFIYSLPRLYRAGDGHYGLAGKDAQVTEFTNNFLQRAHN